MRTARQDPAPGTRSRQTDTRLLGIVPLLVMATMYPVFLVGDAMLGDGGGGYLGWFVGLAVYWLAWGGVFSVRVLGKQRLLDLIRPRRPTAADLGFVTLLVLLATGARYLVPGMEYDKPTIGAWILVLVSPIGNGVFEEVLWRGVYVDRYRNSVLLGVVWPSIGFGLWHLVPISFGSGGVEAGMVIGPMLMGLYLAYLTRRSDSVWWPIVAHILGGYVMVT